MTQPSASKRVLIVDDRRDITMILKTLLLRSGYEVETADDGLSALELARRFAPHALISDLGLPGEMNGFALAEALRGDDSLKTPHMIAVTGRDDPEHRQRASSAGFGHFLVKPANLQELLGILTQIDIGDGADRQSLAR
jgi:DNA-binding response OmpR family regulator